MTLSMANRLAADPVNCPSGFAPEGVGEDGSVQTCRKLKPTMTTYSYGPGFCSGKGCYRAGSWPDFNIGVHDVCFPTRILAGGSDVEWFDEGVMQVGASWKIRIQEADRGALIEARCLDW